MSVQHISFKIGKKSQGENQLFPQTSSKTIKPKPPIVLRNLRSK